MAADTGVAVEVIGDERTLPRSLKYRRISVPATVTHREPAPLHRTRTEDTLDAHTVEGDVAASAWWKKLYATNLGLDLKTLIGGFFFGKKQPQSGGIWGCHPSDATSGGRPVVHRQVTQALNP